MTQPLLAAIKAQNASAHIYVLAPAHLQAVYAAMPEVAQIIPTPFKHGGVQVRARWLLARELKKQNFAAAYVLPNSFKSALIPFWAGIKKRVAYVGEMRRGLLTHTVPNPAKNAKPNMVDFYTALAYSSAQNKHVKNSVNAPIAAPRLVSSASSKNATCAQFGLNSAFVVLCPGAEFGPAKQWPVEHFQTLVRQIIAQKNVQLIILGSAKDVEIGEQIVQAFKGDTAQHVIQNLCGKTTLEQAIHLLAAAQVVVSNDSGLMHIAAALSTPVLAIYGSTSPLHTPPHAHTPALAHIAWLQVDCAPCFQRTCPKLGAAHMRCMRELQPSSVLSFVMQHINSNAY